MIPHLILPGKAVVPTEFTANDCAWKLLGVLAMFGCVVSFDIRGAFGGVDAVLMFTGESIPAWGPFKEMAFLVMDYIILPIGSHPDADL